LTEELVKLIKHANNKPGKPAVEVIYIGNEQSSSELNDFIQKYLSDQNLSGEI